MADGIHRAVGEQAAGQVHIHADQCDDGHDDTDVDDVAPHGGVDHTIGHLTRLTTHHIVGLRIHAHGECGGRIGQ